jgi:hypothetical protein
MISTPCIVTPGTTYAITIESSVTEASGNRYSVGFGAGSNTGEGMVNSIGGTFALSSGYSLNYIEYYAKNTEDVSVTVNGVTANLISNGTAIGDATGILSGAIVNTDTGIYTYENGFNATKGKFSDVFTATSGGVTTGNTVINGWTNTTESIQSASDTTARSVTFKLNTMRNVTGVNVSATAFNNNVNTGLVEISGDNINYNTIIDYPASASAQTASASTNFVSGNTTFYIRLSKDTANGYIRWDMLNVTALIDTTGLPNNQLIIAGTNYYNISSNGRADSASLDPSMLVDVRLMGIIAPNPIFSFFSSFNTIGTAPFTTYLYDQSTNLTGAETFAWDFNDGNTSTSKNVYYTWNATGEYNVTHTVSNGLSSSTSFTNVTVGTPTPPGVAPVASFYGSPTTGNVPLTVFFTDVSSNTPTSWNWSFGDGVYSELQNPTHLYNRSGFRTVNLTATNSAGSNITVRSKFVKVS